MYCLQSLLFSVLFDVYYLVLLYSTLLYSVVFYSITSFSITFFTNQFYSVLFQKFYSIVFLFSSLSDLFYFILFNWLVFVDCVWIWECVQEAVLWIVSWGFVYIHVCVCVHERAYVRAYISIFQSFQFRVLSQQQVNYYRQQSTQGLPSCRIRISYLCVHAVCVCVCLWVWIWLCVFVYTHVRYVRVR